MGGDDAKAVTTVSHTVTNFKSGIDPFAGRIHGELKQGVEIFIESIENHLASRNIVDPNEQFIEAKSHLNLSSGDLGDCTRSLFFRDCKTWGDLKHFLRATYGSGEQKDIVLDLRRVLKLHDRNGASFVAQNAKINDGIMDFISNLSNSNWADKDSHRAISLTNLSRLLQLAVGLHSLPDPLVNSFDEGFSPTSTERDVMTQINKNIGKMQVADSTILKGSVKEGKVVNVGLVAKTQSRPNASATKMEKTYQSTQQQRSTGGGGSQGKVWKCFNCGREGHVKKDCYVRYCNYHQSSTHNWKECRTLNSSNEFRQNRNRSQSRERYRSFSPSRNNSNRWYGNSNFTRGSSPSGANFQRNQLKVGKG